MDSAYTVRCLEKARKVYTFVQTYLGRYTDSIPAGDYDSYSYADELAFAVAVMALVTITKVDTMATTKSFFEIRLA